MNTTINTNPNTAVLTSAETTLQVIRRLLILTLLPAAVGAQAACLTDAPEIGDIGPGSDLVCAQIEERFPDADLAVTNREIHSPTQVSVLASVNGTPIRLRYDLAGFAWNLNGADGIDNGIQGLTDATAPKQGLSMRHD